MRLDIAREMHERLERGESFALATVVRTQGSVPGKLGFQMLVRPDGTQLGTVGGAGLELIVHEACMDFLWDVAVNQAFLEIQGIYSHGNSLHSVNLSATHSDRLRKVTRGTWLPGQGRSVSDHIIGEAPRSQPVLAVNYGNNHLALSSAAKTSLERGCPFIGMSPRASDLDDVCRRLPNWIGKEE